MMQGHIVDDVVFHQTAAYGSFADWKENLAVMEDWMKEFRLRREIFDEWLAGPMIFVRPACVTAGSLSRPDIQ